MVNRQHALHQVEIERGHASHAADLVADQRLLGGAVHRLDAIGCRAGASRGGNRRADRNRCAAGRAAARIGLRRLGRRFMCMIVIMLVVMTVLVTVVVTVFAGMRMIVVMPTTVRGRG
ncbi:hypothetical protein HpMS107_36340 [Helicobacter pylori]